MGFNVITHIICITLFQTGRYLGKMFVQTPYLLFDPFPMEPSVWFCQFTHIADHWYFRGMKRGLLLNMYDEVSSAYLSGFHRCVLHTLEFLYVPRQHTLWNPPLTITLTVQVLIYKSPATVPNYQLIPNSHHSKAPHPSHPVRNDRPHSPH